MTVANVKISHSMKRLEKRSNLLIGDHVDGITAFDIHYRVEAGE
jgi:hypothetical protein